MIKLNSISKEVLFACDLANEQNQQKVRVNSGATTIETSRREIVASGRLIACEYMGNIINKTAVGSDKYVSRMASLIGADADYNSYAQKHKEKKMLFCAMLADKAAGRSTTLKSFEDFKKNNMIYAKDSTFWTACAAIDQDILTPIFFDVISSAGMGLMDWEPVELGATKLINVPSNDVFFFEDSSFGSVNSTTKNYLYATSISLTPKVTACNATIKWYQDMVNGDAGRYYASIMRGMYSKIYARLVGLLNAAISDTTYIPAGLTADTYTSANWLNITDLVAASNGVSVNDLVAIGTRGALSNLLPVDGTGALIGGLAYGLGEQWFTNGFLAKAGGVDLLPVTPAIVPGTQNSTLDTIDTGTNIFVLAKGGYGYRPMMGVYAEGSPLMLSADPLGATGSAQGTADMTININVSAYFDIAPIFASKVGVIQSVYPD